MEVIKCDNCGKEAKMFEWAVIGGENSDGSDDQVWCQDCLVEHGVQDLEVNLKSFILGEMGKV